MVPGGPQSPPTPSPAAPPKACPEALLYSQHGQATVPPSLHQTPSFEILRPSLPIATPCLSCLVLQGSSAYFPPPPALPPDL